LKGLWFTLFGAKAQVVVGGISLCISFGFWVLGMAIFPNAISWPWHWTVATFIFHASMFALVVGSFSIVAAALGYRAAERVEAQVADIEQADVVNVGKEGK
jgi:hypothetical protein